MGWDPGLKARGYSAERRSAACSKVVKVHAITRAYCPRMGRLVFRVRPLYRFVRERLTGLSRGGFTARIEPQRHRDTENGESSMGLVGAAFDVILVRA